MDPYDIGAAFETIEDELIESMIRNMKRHRIEEISEDKEWSQWQAEQLRALELYKKQNQKRFSGRFGEINSTIEDAIKAARAQGNTDQELEILNQIKNGFKGYKKSGKAIMGEFFRMNDRKLEALITATQNDFKRGEQAILRMANDQYRQIIYSAQVYANTGAGTYEKAVDMATKDFLSRGINCIEYANGARHSMRDYADMAIKTASKRAYLAGEGEKRAEWGIHTVIVNKRGNPCPKCLPFVGKVLIDDVYSKGSRKDGNYPLLSRAMELGLYHPRCKDSHTTYFPGISTADDTWTKEELENIGEAYKADQKQLYAKRQVEKFDRLVKYSLDEENQKRYAARREEWKMKHASDHPFEEPDLFDKDECKNLILELQSRKTAVEKQIQSLEKDEKRLTQKVYFDMSGTKDDLENLKQISGKKNSLQEQAKNLESKILDNQDRYRTEAERRILKSGTVEEIKLSKRMKPEAVDILEDTLCYLKEKYGVMPNGVIYSPIKVPDGTAAYNWIDDKIYLSNRFCNPEAYLDTVKKSEESFLEYRIHHGIEKMSNDTIKKSNRILYDKSIKGYEREKAVIAKAEAEITLNTKRNAVRENMSDVLKHEYGHFIHRHAETDYVQKKNVFGMKKLGGKIINGDWKFDINTVYSRKSKISASKISKYATENPYETFAEGFLAMDKGERVPEDIACVIREAVKKAGAKNIAKSFFSGIIELQRKTPKSRDNLKFISDDVFNNLTVSARKKGAIIIRGTKEAEEHLEKLGAAASNLGDVLIFRKDVCISEVLEETYHFEQNLVKMNDDKEEPLRSILNEIDAKQYLLDNADKYKIPRNEIELTKNQLKSYKNQLQIYENGENRYD